MKSKFLEIRSKYQFLTCTMLLCYIVLSCESNPNESENISNLEPYEYFKFKKSIPLKATNTNINSNDLSVALRMQVVDDLLIIHDYFDVNYLYKAFELKTQKLLFKFGRKGQGPGESLYPADLQILNSNTIGLYDSDKHIFMNCIKDSVIKSQSTNVNANKDCTLDMRYFKVCKVNNIFVGTGIFDNRYAISNSKGQIIDKIGSYPFQSLLSEKNTTGMLTMAYQGEFEINEEKSCIAFAMNGSPNIDFMKVKNDTLKVFKSQHIRPPEFKGQDDKQGMSAAFKKNNKFGYISTTSNDKYVYVLYSGKTLKDNEFDTFNSTDIIVFDWDGNPVSYFKLLKKVSSIAVNREGTILYGFANEAEPKILSFTINNSDYLNNIKQ
jgi:hypothetical protein